MARPVAVKVSYTGERSRLSRLEMAIEKDPRLPQDQKTKAAMSIRGLVQALMDLDSTLGSLPASCPPGGDESRAGRSRRRAA